MLGTLLVELYVLCIVIILFIYINILRSRDERMALRFFRILLLSETYFFVIDLLCHCMDLDLINLPLQMNWFINIQYFVGASVAGYLWFLYSENVQKSSLYKNKIYRCAIALPGMVLILLAVLSPRYGIIFDLDEEAHYVEGPFLLMQYLGAYFPILVTSIHALVTAICSKDYEKKNECIVLVRFIIYPIIFEFIQLFWQDMVVLCVWITISSLDVYINTEYHLISLDPLTGINNRYQLNKYLSQKINTYDETKNSLYLLVMDIDYFKVINDTYGHTEGDRALVMVSNALRQVCRDCHCFISRFGGDEFVIIFETIREDEVKALIQKIHEKLLELSQPLPYEIKMSIGMAQYACEMSTSKQLFDEADKRLYAIKKSRKTKYVR